MKVGCLRLPGASTIGSQLQDTVPPETMGPFAAILPQSNHGFDLQFHLGKTCKDCTHDGQNLTTQP